MRALRAKNDCLECAGNYFFVHNNGVVFEKVGVLENNCTPRRAVFTVIFGWKFAGPSEMFDFVEFTECFCKNG